MLTYGRRSTDVILDSRGNALNDVEITLHETEAHANAGTSAVGTVYTNAAGRWRFDWTAGELWARITRSASVWRLDDGLTEIGELLSTATTRDEARRAIGITVGDTAPVDPVVGDIFISTA